MRNVTQVLYSGLGGHGSVVFSFLAAAEKDDSFDHSLIFYGIEPTRVDYIEKVEANNLRFREILKRKGADYSSYLAYWKSLVALSSDVIILHSLSLIIPTFIYAVLYKKRIIAVEHTPNQAKRRSEWLWSILSMFFASNIVLLTSLYENELSHKLGIFYKEDKINIIPNGIDITQYYPIIKPEETTKLKLGMVSRLSETKDHETLIRGLKHFLQKKENTKQIVLHIAGDGETRIRLETLVKELHLDNHVIFLGMIKEQEVVTFLQSLDIYIHASLGETMPTAIMQAMACSLPIIASDIPGINNLIEDSKTGLLFKPKHVEGLSGALTFLVENKINRVRLSNEVRIYAECYLSNIIMYEKYKDLVK